MDNKNSMNINDMDINNLKDIKDIKDFKEIKDIKDIKDFNNNRELIINTNSNTNTNHSNNTNINSTNLTNTPTYTTITTNTKIQNIYCMLCGKLNCKSCIQISDNTLNLILNGNLNQLEESLNLNQNENLNLKKETNEDYNDNNQSLNKTIKEFSNEDILNTLATNNKNHIELINNMESQKLNSMNNIVLFCYDMLNGIDKKIEEEKELVMSYVQMNYEQEKEYILKISQNMNDKNYDSKYGMVNINNITNKFI